MKKNEILELLDRLQTVIYERFFSKAVDRTNEVNAEAEKNISELMIDNIEAQQSISELEIEIIEKEG